MSPPQHLALLFEEPLELLQHFESWTVKGLELFNPPSGQLIVILLGLSQSQQSLPAVLSRKLRSSRPNPFRNLSQAMKYLFMTHKKKVEKERESESTLGGMGVDSSGHARFSSIFLNQIFFFDFFNGKKPFIGIKNHQLLGWLFCVVFRVSTFLLT